MRMAEIMVPIAALISLVLMLGLVTKLFSNISLNRTMREALRAHPDSVRLLADRLDARQPWADALIGWIFIAFTIGLVLVSLFEPADERRDIWQAAIVPLVIGVVVIAYVRWAGRNQDARLAAGETVPPPAPVVAPPPPAQPPSPPRRRSRPASQG